MQAGFYDAAGYIRIAVIEDRAGACRLRTPDVLGQTVKRVCAGVGDAVVDDAGSVAELRGKAVGDGIDLFDIRVRDGKETKAILVCLGVYHAVELEVDAIDEAIGIERARNAVFRIGMAADARLKEDEVVRVARGERKVLRLLRGDGAAEIEAGWFDDGSVIGDLDLSGNRADREMLVDVEICTCAKVNSDLCERREASR